MEPTKFKRFLAAVVAVVPTTFVWLYSQTFGGWKYFFSDTHSLHFTDLRPITANLSCRQSNPLWSINGPSCDPWERILNYPKVWLDIFEIFGLNDSKVGIAGALVAASLIGGLFLVIYSAYGTTIDVWLAVALSVSPPVMFLLERGNVDGFIFLLLIASGLGVSSSRRWVRVIGACGIFVAAILKVFPVGAFVLAFFAGRVDRRNFWKRTFLVVAGGILAGIILLPEASRIFANTPSFPGMQFGSRALPLEFGHCFPRGTTFGYCTWNSTSEFSIGFAVVAVLVGLLILADLSSASVRNQRASTWRIIRSSRQFQSIFVSFSGAYIVAFMLGSSWYYRFVFLIPVALVARRTRSSLGSWLVGAVLVCTYSIAGNVLYLIVVGQVAATMIAVVLTWMLIIEAWENFREGSMRQEGKDGSSACGL